MSEFSFEVVSELLRCPESGARFVYDGERLVSTDPETRLSYSVAHGIPNLLVQDAVTLDQETWQAIIDKSEATAASTRDREN